MRALRCPSSRTSAFTTSRGTTMSPLHIIPSSTHCACCAVRFKTVLCQHPQHFESVPRQCPIQLMPTRLTSDASDTIMTGSQVRWSTQNTRCVSLYAYVDTPPLVHPSYVPAHLLHFRPPHHIFTPHAICCSLTMKTRQQQASGLSAKSRAQCVLSAWRIKALSRCHMHTEIMSRSPV